MTWYAAHIIESIKPMNKKSDNILIYENIVLIEADDEKKALRKAKEYAKKSIGGDETLHIGNEPAIASFAGIRKLIAISNPSPLKQDEDAPTSGTEISYSRYSVKSERDLKKLAKGDPITVEYVE